MCTDDLPKLLNCPFCGGPVLIHRRTDGQVDGIVCDECLLTLEAVDVYPKWHTLDELVRRWNARAERTCRNTDTVPDDGSVFYPSPHFRCSECGASYALTDYAYYCPNCGAKVVAE